MKRVAQVWRLVLVLGTAAAAAKPAVAYQPTKCAHPTIMQTELARFGDGYLTDATGQPDNLYYHVMDLFRFGIGHDIDPRLGAAIAGTESRYGTMDTTCVRNDNPWSLGRCRCNRTDPTCTGAYGEVTGSIASVSYDLDLKVHRGCNRLAHYGVGGICEWCDPGPGPTPTPGPNHEPPPCMYWNAAMQRMDTWLDVFAGRYGGNRDSLGRPANLGGDPGTTSLTYPGQCNTADCNGDGQTTADEVLTAVKIALGEEDPSACTAAAVSVPCVSEEVPAGQAAAAGTPFCDIVTVSGLATAIYVADNVPGDPVPLPTVPPWRLSPDSSVCESGSCHDPCAACDTGDGLDCDACPCGEAECGFCEMWCVTPTPTPPPTPTPTPTAACLFKMYRIEPTGQIDYSLRKGQDCERMYSYAHVKRPFTPTRVELTQAAPFEKIDLNRSPATYTSFAKTSYFTGTGGFWATITAYDARGELCSQTFFDPEALGINTDVNSQYHLCGTGGDTTAGLVRSPPPTPTPTPSCQFQISRSSGTDCTAVTVTGSILSPPDAVTNADHLTLEQDNQLPIDTASGTFSRVAYFAGNGAGDFWVRLNIYDVNGNALCPEAPYKLTTDGPDSWTQCGYDSGGRGLVPDRPPTPAPRYTYDLTVRQGYTGAPFDAVVDVWPPAADSRVTAINIAQPNGPFSGGPLTLHRTAPGHWVGYLCYDGDECVGGYTLTFNVFGGTTLLESHNEQIVFAGCSSWPCDPRCSDQCACQACSERFYCVENRSSP